MASIPGLRSPTGAGHFRKDISMGSFDTPGKPAMHIQLTSHGRVRLLVIWFLLPIGIGRLSTSYTTCSIMQAFSKVSTDHEFLPWAK